MKFLSLCSGIEAASVAWHDLGFECVGVSEIEKFPSAVLNYHYPSVPNLGDMTRFKEWKDDLAFDLLVGGTPCQSFSVAGLRKGLDDPRGNLALTYCAIAERYQPKWIVWENVPGVLSSNGGKDFASFVTALGEIGYHLAYRVLDAQYFGVPQRRKRVFVVGYLGDWKPATAVLFEPNCGSGNTKTSRKARKSSATDSQESIGENESRLYENHPNDSRIKPISISPSLSTWCSNGTIPLVRETLPYDLQQITSPTSLSVHGFNTNARPDEMKLLDNQSNTLTASQKVGIVQADVYAFDSYNCTIHDKNQPLLSSRGDLEHTGGIVQADTSAMSIRKLTPIECERLQGFPDNYTRIPYGKKDAESCPDSPRYKALGNSMAVPVMRWIGKRIKLADEVFNAIQT